jgi:SPP1 family predicted phage head-tail adaptor
MDVIRAGELRHSVVIQTNTESQSYGELTDSWGTFATVSASIEPLSGREFFDSRHTGAELTHRVRMRYLAGVTPKMRVSYTDPDAGARLFDIQEVIDVKELRRVTLLMVKEVVSA